MKTEKLPAFTRNYLLALRKHLDEDADLEPHAAKTLGRRAVAIGLEILDLAKVHEKALITIGAVTDSSSVPVTMIRPAIQFFAAVVTQIEMTHSSVLEGTAELKIAVDELTQRTKELSESNCELREEVTLRKAVEESLRTSERTSSELLEKSLNLQEELRLLSRNLLCVQEEDRKRISRDLHDLVAQTLNSITLQLTTLKSRADSNAQEFEKKIEDTQLLIEKSVDLVHRFARNLRPSLLDDLGLIPALESCLKGFMEETGVRVKLTAFADVEKLNNVKRTALFRVAQEALNNVAEHAKASEVEVKIHLLGKLVCMEIHDNGKGFRTGNDVFSGKQSERLGLLGMRERVEMVGGSFSVQSTPGEETIVSVEVPRLNSKPAKRRGKKPTMNYLKSK